MARADLPSWTRPVAHFWLGRAQAAAGEPEAARNSWNAGVESDPSSYYGLRAAEWSGTLDAPAVAESRAVSGAGTPTAQPTARPATSAQATVDLAAWLRSWAGEGALTLPATVLQTQTGKG
jgi:hypothetical protein